MKSCIIKQSPRQLLRTWMPTNAGELVIDSDAWDCRDLCRVMPVIPGEQDVFCQLATYRPGERVFEVGYGSGVLMLHAGMCGADVRGIDNSSRAYQMAGLNADRALRRENPAAPRGQRCRVYFACGEYDNITLARHSQDTIIMNPPFHPTAPFWEIPLHGSADEAGTSMFTGWVRTLHAGQHLKPGGRLLFYMMLPGNDGQWPAMDQVLKTLRWRYSHCHLRFTRVLPTFDYEEFLCHICAGSEQELQWAMKKVAYCLDVDLIWGEITVGTETNCVEEFDHGLDVGTTWEERIQLHRRLVLEARARQQVRSRR